MTQVFKVSKAGNDASRCADYNLLFDNRWKTMKVLAQDEITIIDTGSSGSALLFTHNLGYYPAFMVFVVDANGSNPPDYLVSKAVQCTDTELRWYHNGDSLGSITLYFYVFLNNLEEVIDGTDINIIADTDESVRKIESRFGISKPDYDTASPPKDLIAASAYSSFAIHKVSTGTKSNDILTLAHDLGYYPMFLIFGKGGDLASTGYRNLNPPASDHYCGVSESDLSVIDGYSYDYSIFILKNPAGF